MEPILGIVARTGAAAVAFVNPRDDPPLVESYDVRSVPTFVLFRDGRPVARLADGFVETEALLKFVADADE
jgi:thioredoxin-like negative regulator of GroEL